MRFLKWLVFILTCKGEIGKDAVRAGLVDFGGQGRDNDDCIG